MHPDEATAPVVELALAAGVPTALGLWRTGFAVSYGYGGAIAASAYLYLQKTSGVAKLHATALAFYGCLLYTSPSPRDS